ncbi:MAG: hypothetical protein AAF570_14640, partial [Bacteroidota bacterium]
RLPDGSSVHTFRHQGTNPIFTYIVGSTTFDTLAFEVAGTEVWLQQQKRFSVNDAFELNSDCEHQSALYSSHTSVQCTLSAPSANVWIDHVRLASVHAEPGLGFSMMASNIVEHPSNNRAGNTGWTTLDTLLIPALYWIGGNANAAGNGYWNDGQNWSRVSGGPPAFCTPTPYTNAIFDAQSFSTGTIRVESQTVTVPTCHDLIWSGFSQLPELITIKLEVHGSLMMDEDVDCDRARLYFLSRDASGETIKSNFNEFQRFSFDEHDGTWTLQDSLLVHGMGALGTLYLYAGTLHTNDFPIYTHSFRAAERAGASGRSRNLLAGMSRIYCEKSSAYGLQFLADSPLTTLDLDSATIFLRASSSNAPPGLHIRPIVGTPHIFRIEILGGGNVPVNLPDGATVGRAIQRAPMSVDWTLIGTVRYDTISMYGPGGALLLNPADSFTVQREFSLASDCANRTTLRSTDANQRVTLRSDSIDLVVNDVIMSNIRARGNGPNGDAANNMITDQAWNLVGNIDWENLSFYAGQTLYWIGGQPWSAPNQRWNDAGNWSLTSGGMPQSCIPDPLTTVIFDDSSFTVGQDSVRDNTNSNGGVPKCLDMHWVGTTVPAHLNGNFEVYGSLNMQDSVDDKHSIFKSADDISYT